ncbi:DUF4349 domain-containing protein [Nocardioides sp. IC4_145]|uniref:DUF4349 domain-containing protein n=1 Tax=Nocardioides sp. IC4_145 TaxID=2714037 RepID=UPI00140A10B2|nr:DUF4349 domain-containing protein [Nocardioides sp. IC4_145]NHC24161.1 DUF4349 domain-containing protein [Nocardioides sp. IC4_145]
MTPRTRLAAASLVALAALGSACSTGASDGGSSADTSADTSAGGSVADAPAAESRQDALAFSDEADGAVPITAASVDTDRKVISTGNVALRAEDVGEARAEVQEVVDRYDGEVAEENTGTDDDGDVARSRLVLRVPTARFDEAVESLTGVADLVDASTTSEDVTTKVLDVDIRVRVQRRSIRRIELLLDRAESIRDIVAIEAQLSRRQADLASLEKQQDHLADQTAQSTITVSIARTREGQEAEPEADDAGFLTGLASGWDGLVTTAVAAATVLGAVLPFAAVALLLGLPAWALLRRLRRRPAVPAE